MLDAVFAAASEEQEAAIVADFTSVLLEHCRVVGLG